jgi:translocation and assembly module TamA
MRAVKNDFISAPEVFPILQPLASFFLRLCKGLSKRNSGLLSLISVLFFSLALPLQLFAADPLTIVVEGVEGEIRDNVVAALSLPEGFAAQENVDRLLLERLSLQAEKKVKTAVEPFGYYHAKVALQIEENPPGEFLLRVVVNPGEPLRLTDVSVHLKGPGAAEEPLKRLADLFPLAKGDVLIQQKYEKTKEALLSTAHELGYLDAAFAVHEIAIAKDALSAQIRLELETGGKYFFGGIAIEGAPNYREKFLHRYLFFREGDVFSYEKLGETQINFVNSERFKEVNIVPEKEQATEARVPVLVFLKEGPSRSLRQGIGYGTDTGGRFSLRYRDLNMFHLGHELHANLYLSEFLQGLSASYVMPDDNDIKNSTSVQLNIQREDISTYESDFISVELDKTSSIGRESFATGYLRFQYENYAVGSQESYARLVMPGLRVSGNYYDNKSHPQRGFHYAVELRGTDEMLGSNMQLVQAITEGGFILPLPGRLFLHARAKAASSILGDPLGDLPPSLRFFAGGDQSVRGYAYQSLGPRDASGQVIGGKHLLVGSVEVERAIAEDWGVSVFYDAGNAFDSFSDFRIYEGVGMGLHYYTRVGALNFSVARQIGVDDPGFRIHFTIGLGM